MKSLKNGCDIAVLHQLARFSDPPIVVIVPDRLAEYPLPQFLETDATRIINGKGLN